MGLRRDVAVRRIRAMSYMRDRLGGLSNGAIAKKHNVNVKTVAKTLTWAEKAKIFVELEDELLQGLAPLAIDALKHALAEKHDAQAALEVLKGLNLLKKSHPITAKEVQDSSDLFLYVQQIREKAELDAATVEGQHELIPGYSPELLQLPPASADGRIEGEGVDPGQSADPESHDSSDAGRAPEGDGGAAPPREAEEGSAGDENRVSGDEGAGADPEPSAGGDEK